MSQNQAGKSADYSDFQTMNITSVKFQKNQYKIVGGVANTMYPLSIHFDILMFNILVNSYMIM